MYEQPVALKGKLYVEGGSWVTGTVVEYTPGHDKWTELSPPPVTDFTMVTLRGKLLVVGGEDKSILTRKPTQSTHSMNTLNDGSNLVLPCLQHQPPQLS